MGEEDEGGNDDDDDDDDNDDDGCLAPKNEVMVSLGVEATLIEDESAGVTSCTTMALVGAAAATAMAIWSSVRSWASNAAGNLIPAMRWPSSVVTRTTRSACSCLGRCRPCSLTTLRMLSHTGRIAPDRSAMSAFLWPTVQWALFLQSAPCTHWCSVELYVCVHAARVLSPSSTRVYLLMSSCFVIS